MGRNYYDVLDVPKNADEAAIKKAYKKVRATEIRTVNFVNFMSLNFDQDSDQQYYWQYVSSVSMHSSASFRSGLDRQIEEVSGCEQYLGVWS